MLSKNSLQFLEDLKQNNNRDWFLTNKKRYEEYKKDYHQLIGAFLDVMKPMDPSLEMLEVKNCTFRINRDIRFSKDKSPYKTHMGMWFNGNLSQTNAPGYYIHIEKNASFIAGGLYGPEAADLKKIRKEIAFFQEDLEEILNDKKFKSLYGGLSKTATNSLKTAPKGYEKDHAAIELLKFKSFTASHKLSDAEILDKDFVKNTAEKLEVLKPLIDFLNRGLTSEA